MVIFTTLSYSPLEMCLLIFIYVETYISISSFDTCTVIQTINNSKIVTVKCITLVSLKKGYQYFLMLQAIIEIVSGLGLLQKVYKDPY